MFTQHRKSTSVSTLAKKLTSFALITLLSCTSADALAKRAAPNSEPTVTKETVEENGKTYEVTTKERYRTYAPNEVHLMYIAQNAAYDALVQDLVTRQLTTLRPECEKADRIVRQLPKIYEPVEFPKNMPRTQPPKHPIIGQWKEVIKLQACGKIHTFNFLASASKKSQPLILPLINGATNIDPIYQMQAIRKVRKTIEAYHSEHCKQGGKRYIQSTRILGYLQADRTIGKKDEGRGWFEKWNVWHCKGNVEATLALVTNAAGNYDIRVKLNPNSK